jgi:hypothetical protein
MRLRIARRGGVLTLAAIATLLAGVVPASAAPGDGSAYGAMVNVTLLGANAVHAGPFAAASTNGPTTDSLASVDVPGVLRVGVINNSARRDDSTGAVTSEANTADVTLPLLSELGPIGAKVIEARCTATQSGVRGTTSIVGASLGALGRIATDPAPNTELSVSLPGVGNVATLIINEQIANPDGSLTVNALHLKLLGSGLVGTIGSGDVIVSSATCGPAGLPVPMASGLGLWLGIGLLGAIGVPVAVLAIRRRRGGAVASV